MLSKIKVSVYPKVTAKQFKEVDIFDIYESIKDSYKEETLSICERFADDILNKTKGKYQQTKTNTLQAVVFSGCFNRSDSENEKAKHSGRINFDIDENTKEELTDFLNLIKTGKIPFVEAAALSVSGLLTGSFWINVKADIPSRLSAVLPEIVKILHLTKDKFKAKLHTAYYEMFADMLIKEGIKAGKTKDLKRTRYLTFDADIYINRKAEYLSQNKLLAYLNSKKQETFEDFDSDSDDIIQSDAFKYAEDFALKKFTLTEGQKHLYLNRLAICLNGLGIEKNEAQAYIQKKGIKVTSNCIEYPYKKYSDNFGQWKHKLKIEIPEDYSLTLASGEKLSDKKNELFDIIRKESAVSKQVKLDLSSGTGSGKSFLASKDLPSFFKKLNGLKTVIVFPLNSKTEKDAKQYKIPFVTGEHLKTGKSKVLSLALKSDVILTNINTFEFLAEKIGKQLNVIIDESHTLPNAMTSGYKPKETLKMFEAAKRFSKVLILMSGTQKKYFNLIGFKKIQVKQSERPKIKLTVKNKELKTELAVLDFIQNYGKLDGKKLLIKIQSKEAIERIYKLLIRKGYSKKQIVKLYSCPKIKKTEAYKRIINSESNEESFADDVEIILCTSFVNEGLDIYSSFEIITVSVLSHHTIDVDDEIQFFDRHRTNKEKSSFLLIPEPKKGQKLPNDYSLYLFKEGLQASRKVADLFNELEENKSPLKPIFSTQTQFSSFEKTLIYSDVESKIIVNELQLMLEAETRRKASTGKKEALAEIRDRFEYFDIIDGSNEVTSKQIDTDSETTLEAITLEEKIEITKIQQELQLMLNESKEGLIQAVAEHTEDVGIKKKAAKRLTAKAKDYSLNFISDKKQVFEEGNQAEKLTKRIFRLEDMFLNDDEIKKTLFKDSGEFYSSQTFYSMSSKYKIHLLCYLFDKHKNKLTKQQISDAKRFSKAKESLSSLSEKASSDDIFQALKPIFKKSLTQRKAVRLARILFETSRTKGDYLLKSERNLESYLKELNLDSERILTKISKADAAKEETSLSKIIIQESNTLQYAY
jgi:predicted transport protein